MDGFFNDTNVCPIADELIDLIWDMKNTTTNGADVGPIARVGVPSGIFLVSVVALFAGRLFLRPLSVMTAFFVATGFAYRTARAHASDDTPCAPGMIFSFGAGLVAALFSLWVLNVAMFAIGAAVGGGLAHTVFMTFPQLHAGQATPVGNSTAYWVSLACAGIAGGVVVKYYSKFVLEVVSSGLGAVGIALSSFALSSFVDHTVSRAPFVFFGIFGFFVGVWAQRRRRLRPTVSEASRQSGGTTGSTRV